ncbi:hypothetical protein AKG34_13370 [Peribacillus butanolivorans]|uniref:HK97-gp10 family putative phage morphogenesis protein n=1 Tax=Peribacillus butanolivorans TaxID=421767 RepID=UPI0006A6C55D|nr:HK97-gp10 family putative phage morphogenesis protein [Peribacillus butanolivorans]KON69639.1 hypothetical protein AKG34_13370 [Peribacillus butanolivorans]
MSNTVSFDVKGYEQIIKKIEELGRKGARVRNEAIRAGGEVFKEELEQAIPRTDINHEHLQDAIIVTDIKRTGGIPHVQVGSNKGEGTVGWKLHIIENGTMFMSPRAPVQKTLQASKTKVKQRMKEVMQKGLGL